MRVRLPMAGKACSNRASPTVIDQLVCGLPDHASYGSCFATRYGAEPAEVQPPSEDENWVNAGAPSYSSTSPLDALIPAVEAGSSPLAPPYTWQDVVSHSW